MTVRLHNGNVAGLVAYGDRHFRHELRNIRNSLGLALRAYEISDPHEQVELLDMVMDTVDQAIALLDANEADTPDEPPTPPPPVE